MPERTYTTHDIAEFCDVYPSTVIQWINGGKLKSYATPGGHNRVVREDLIAFLRAHGMPLPRELAERPLKVLIVDDDDEVTRILAKAFARRAPGLETEVCHDGVEALVRIGRNPPDLVVLDVVIPQMDGIQICRVLKSRPETEDVKIIAISGKKSPFGDKKPSDLKIDAYFRKPLDLIELVDKTVEILRLDPLPAAGGKEAVR